MDYKNVNDYEIIYMIRENDDDARNLIFNKYLPIVKSIANKYYVFFKQNGADYDDFVQEGLIALNKAMNTYDENCGSLFYTYASLCITRQIITYCRNLCSKKHYILNNSIRDEDIFLYVNNGDSVDDYLCELYKEEEFIEIKNLFPLKYSSVFELRYNGFCYKEISELLNISVSTVDSRLSKIRYTLHNMRKNVV